MTRAEIRSSQCVPNVVAVYSVRKTSGTVLRIHRYEQRLMTLNYYSGQDIYYFSGVDNGTQKFLVPVYDKQVCFDMATEGSNSCPHYFLIEKVFPQRKRQRYVSRCKGPIHVTNGHTLGELRVPSHLWFLHLQQTRC